MQLKQQSANANVMQFNNGMEILFSYETPVAAFVPRRGYLRTEVKFSNSTSKHISAWIGLGVIYVEVPQAEIEQLIGGI